MSRPTLSFWIALLLGVAVARAHCQDSSKPEPQKPDATQTLPQQPGPPPSQMPGFGAQVRTGSVVGDGSALAIFTKMTTLLGDHRFLEMQEMLEAQQDAVDSASGTSGKLTSGQKQLFQGILANRQNKPEASIKLLEPLLATLPLDTPAAEEKLLRTTLAEDYLRSGDLAKASAAYQSLEARLSANLTPEEQEDLELPLKLLPLAAANPPMTVELGDPFALPYDRDALGLIDVPVFVDARSHDWMLDPTAPFNLICRSTAKEVGLKLSAESATVHTLTGRAMAVHATVIPRFTLGTITYRNMTAFVFEDADYYFPRTAYQVRGVLGYPAISALGSLTVTASSRIEVQPGDKGEHLTTGAPFFLDGDRVIVALGKAGDERMFAIDAGGQQTYLTSRYFAEHAADFEGKKMQLLALPGGQDKPPAPAYVADSVTLTVGDTPMRFHFMQVLPEPLGAAAVDDTYGTLGMDALDELKSYTFDYRTMRFGIQTEPDN